MENSRHIVYGSLDLSLNLLTLWSLVYPIALPYNSIGLSPSRQSSCFADYQQQTTPSTLLQGQRRNNLIASMEPAQGTRYTFALSRKLTAALRVQFPCELSKLLCSDIPVQIRMGGSSDLALFVSTNDISRQANRINPRVLRFWGDTHA